MKKLALLLCGLGSLAVLSVSAQNYSSAQAEPQYQEQCVPAPCVPDTVCNQLPCNVPVNCNTPVNCTNPTSNTYKTSSEATGGNAVYCAPDTVCNPAPCYAPVNCVTPVNNQAPAQTQNQAVVVPGCC